MPATLFGGVWCTLKVRTSRLLRDTDGRKSFSILSIARTISSNTFLWRSSFTTLTWYTNTTCPLINACFQHCSQWCQNKTFCASSQIKWYLLNIVHFYPDTEEGADRLVVARLQLHVTPVFQLVDIVPSPKDSVTPGRHAALPTAGITVLQANRDSHHTQTQRRWLYTGVSVPLTGLQKAYMVAKLNRNSKRRMNVAAKRLWILHPGIFTPLTRTTQKICTSSSL